MKRYGRSGWFRESHRHYLAAKGIKTARFVQPKSQGFEYFAGKQSERKRKFDNRVREIVEERGISYAEAREIAREEFKDIPIQERGELTAPQLSRDEIIRKARRTVLYKMAEAAQRGEKVDLTDEERALFESKEELDELLTRMQRARGKIKGQSEYVKYYDDRIKQLAEEYGIKYDEARKMVAEEQEELQKIAEQEGIEFTPWTGESEQDPRTIAQLRSNIQDIKQQGEGDETERLARVDDLIERKREERGELSKTLAEARVIAKAIAEKEAELGYSPLNKKFEEKDVNKIVAFQMQKRAQTLKKINEAQKSKDQAVINAAKDAIEDEQADIFRKLAKGVLTDADRKRWATLENYKTELTDKQVDRFVKPAKITVAREEQARRQEVKESLGTPSVSMQEYAEKVSKPKSKPKPKKKEKKKSTTVSDLLDAGEDVFE